MTESELKADVREITGYTDGTVLTDSTLNTAYKNAQRHLRVTAGLDRDIDWYNRDEPARAEALYWWTCLFTKVAVGDLDSQDLQIGAVDSKALLAKDDDSITQWYRNASQAKKAVTAAAGNGFAHRHETVREDRTYGSGGSSSGSGTSGLDTNI